MYNLLHDGCIERVVPRAPLVEGVLPFTLTVSTLGQRVLGGLNAAKGKVHEIAEATCTDI